MPAYSLDTMYEHMLKRQQGWKYAKHWVTVLLRSSCWSYTVSLPTCSPYATSASLKHSGTAHVNMFAVTTALTCQRSSSNSPGCSNTKTLTMDCATRCSVWRPITSLSDRGA